MYKSSQLFTFFLISLFFVNFGEASLFKRKTPSQKYLVAVLPVENESNNGSLEKHKKRATQLFLENLYLSNKFRLVELEKIGDVLGKSVLARDTVFDNRKEYIESIKALGAEMVVICNFTDFDVRAVGDKKVIISLTMDGRLVNLINGEIVCMKSVTSEIKRKLDPSRLEYGVIQATKEEISSSVSKVVKKLSKYIAKRSRTKS